MKEISRSLNNSHLNGVGSIQSLSLSDLMNPIHSFLSMASLFPIPSELSLVYLATFIAESLATSLDSYLGSRALLSSEVTKLSSFKSSVF